MDSTAFKIGLVCAGAGVFFLLCMVLTVTRRSRIRSRWTQAEALVTDARRETETYRADDGAETTYTHIEAVLEYPVDGRTLRVRHRFSGEHYDGYTSRRSEWREKLWYNPRNPKKHLLESESKNTAAVFIICALITFGISAIPFWLSSK